MDDHRCFKPLPNPTHGLISDHIFVLAWNEDSRDPATVEIYRKDDTVRVAKRVQILTSQFVKVQVGELVDVLNLPYKPEIPPTGPTHRSIKE